MGTHAMAPSSPLPESSAADAAAAVSRPASTEPTPATAEGATINYSEERDMPQRMKRKSLPKSDDEEKRTRTRRGSDRDHENLDAKKDRCEKRRRLSPSPKAVSPGPAVEAAVEEEDDDDGSGGGRGAVNNDGGGDLGRRQAAATQEDKRRGRRLFGGLLSTLSQRPSNTPQQKRRLEIERRQRERMRKQDAEDGLRQAERLSKLRATRMREQIVFDEEVMRNRHAKKLAQARFLQTRAEPRIYYLPWKCTDDELDVIDAQVKRARDLVRREMRDFEKRRKWYVDRHGAAERPRPRSLSPSPSPSREGLRAPETFPAPTTGGEAGEEEKKEKRRHGDDDIQDKDGDEARQLGPQEEFVRRTEPDGKDQTARARADAHDDAGDVVEHAGEDMVIY